MPSAEHETPIALANVNLSVMPWLMGGVFNIKVPECQRANKHPTEVQVIVPRTYRSDCVTVFCDADDKPLMAAVFEVQRTRDRSKLRTWKLYVAQLETELNVDVSLLVYCPDPAMARWYRGLLDSESSSIILRPFIFTPADIPLTFDVELARSDPDLALAVAVFSLICHGDQPSIDEMFPALAEALSTADPDRALLYYDIVLAGLPAPARLRWEAFMSSVAEKYHSEVFREIAARNFTEGEAQGEAKGEAQAVLTVLEARGIPASDEVRQRILACTDLATLDTWLRRAVTASSAGEVVD